MLHLGDQEHGQSRVGRCSPPRHSMLLDRLWNLLYFFDRPFCTLLYPAVRNESLTAPPDHNYTRRLTTVKQGGNSITSSSHRDCSIFHNFPVVRNKPLETASKQKYTGDMSHGSARLTYLDIISVLPWLHISKPLSNHPLSHLSQTLKLDSLRAPGKPSHCIRCPICW